jgi:hypothetical protein
MNPARPLQVEISGPAIDPADRANALVAGKYLLAQVACVCAKPPFMDAPVRTESESARGNFKTAPPAERSAIQAFFKGGSIGKPAGHGSRSAHETFLTQIVLACPDHRSALPGNADRQG